MDVNIVRDERNELLDRREIEFMISFEGATPPRYEIKGKICAMLNIKEELCVLGPLEQHFGKTQLEGALRAYDTQESLSQVEEEYLIKRGAAPQAAAPEPEETAEPAAEPEVEAEGA